MSITTVSAANICDASGAKIANATAKFIPCTPSGTPLPGFTISSGSGGQATAQTISAPIVAGALSVTLQDTTQTNPVNIAYRFEVRDAGNTLLLGPYVIQPSGTTWSLDTYSPNMVPLDFIQTGRPGTLISSNRGIYSTLTSYALGDVVALNGTTYVSLQPMNLDNDPGVATNTTPSAWWQVVASAGQVTNAALASALAGPLAPVSVATNNIALVDSAITAFPLTVDYAHILVADDGRSIIAAWNTDGTITSPSFASGLSAVGSVQSFADDVKATGRFIGKDQAVCPPNTLGLDNATVANDGRSIIQTAGTLPYFPSASPFIVSPSLYSEPLAPEAFTADINHVIGDGQSLEAAADSVPVLTTAQPFSNLKFSEGVGPGTVTSSDTFVPLVADTNLDVHGETFANGFADSVSNFVKSRTLRHDILVSSVGVSGASYASICGPTDYTADPVNGSPSFAKMTSQVVAASAIATAANKKYAVRGFLWSQGETEADPNNYFTHLATMQKDVQTMVTAKTGQTLPVTMYMDQCIYPVGLTQLQRAVASPDTHTLIGPGYIHEHTTAAQIAGGSNPLHLTANGQRIRRCRLYKAYRYETLCGKKWVPLQPAKITVINTTVVIDYFVPVGPLVFDTSVVSDPTNGNYGFTVHDTSGAVITNAAITGQAQVTLTLDRYPSGAFQVTYAYDNFPAGPGGVLGNNGGPRGCLRDSDSTMSYYPDTTVGASIPLYNYGVSFAASFTL